MCAHCMADIDFKWVLKWIPHRKWASISMKGEDLWAAKTIDVLSISLAENFYDKKTV